MVSRALPVLPGAAYKAPRGPASGSRSVFGCEREGGGYPPRDKRRGPSKWKLESWVACRPAFQATLSHTWRPEARAGVAASRTLDSSVLGLALYSSALYGGFGSVPTTPRVEAEPGTAQEEWRAG